MAPTASGAEQKKLLAEAAEIEAKTARAAELHQVELDLKRAELAKLRAEAEETAAAAEVQKIQAAVSRDDEANRQADNFHNRVYRFTTGVSEATVATCISTLDKWHRIDPQGTFEIIFTSPGGDVIAGLSLVDHIRSMSRAGHKMVVGTEGWAASMAGILLQAGDHRWIGRESWLLIHEVSFGAHGNTSEIMDQVKWIERVQERVIRLFIEKAQASLDRRGDGQKALTMAQFKTKWKKTDWTLDSQESYDAGFVDEIR
jgi:ATP-dependent Clp protease protease subunit